MITITQNGFKFIYRAPRPSMSPLIEEWDIERVGAFVFLVEFYRISSQKYVGKYTLVAAVGSIQYELDGFDKETNRDIDKLTRLMLPYTQAPLSYMWNTQFNKALDLAERMIREKVSELQAPVESMGRTITPRRFYSRPTEEEYITRLEAERSAAMEAVGASSPEEVVRVWFSDYGSLMCRIVKETNSFVWVDGYDNGRKVIDSTRIRKDSSRVMRLVPESR